MADMTAQVPDATNDNPLDRQLTSLLALAEEADRRNDRDELERLMAEGRALIRSQKHKDGDHLYFSLINLCDLTSDPCQRLFFNALCLLHEVGMLSSFCHEFTPMLDRAIQQIAREQLSHGR